MPFTKTTWVDGSEPAITATQLNRIEAGIEDAHAGDLDAASIDTAVLVDKAVTNAKFRDSVGPSVVGRAANSTGSVADISAASDGQVLRRASGSLGFGTVATAGIGDLQVTTDKLAAGAVTTAKIGDSQVTNAKIASGVDAAKLTTGTLPTARIADNSLPYAKLSNLIEGAFLGRTSGVGTGPVEGMTATQARTILNVADGANAYVHPNHTGDVTSTGDGATVIANGAVTNAKIASGVDASKLTTGTLPVARIGANAISNDKIRQSAALSVVGRSANSTGNVADIAAATDGHVLRRSGTSIGFGTIVNSATTATPANTANAIVARNAAGNFTTNSITTIADVSIRDVRVGRGAGGTATFSTAVGENALDSNTFGAGNTAIGNAALTVNTTGDFNTALGVSGLKDTTTGSYNIGVGFVNSDGYNPVFNPTTQSNRLVMGHTGITNAYVQVAWTVTSDERDKTNFKPVPHGLDFVTKLKPVAFQFKKTRDEEEPHGPVHYGFKAQDVLKLEGKNPVMIDTEDPERLKYHGESLVPVLVRAIQELKAEVDQLKSTCQCAVKE